MPPEQCPECGRFLKNALVAGLAGSPEPCPKCGTELTAEMFELESASAAEGRAGSPEPDAAREAQEAAGGGPPPPPPPQGLGDLPDLPAPPPPPGAVRDLAQASVRPPDLAPEAVRDAPDPLAGWDAGEPPVGGPVDDRRPFPLDAAVVAGGGTIGVLVGLLLGRRPARDAALGGLLGVALAGVARRIWRSP